MNCLVKITGVINGIKQKGSSAVLTIQELQLLPLIVLNDNKQIDVSEEDETNLLHEIFHPNKSFKMEFLDRLIHENVFERIIELENLSDSYGVSIAHIMVHKKGCEFTVEQLSKLGNPSDNEGRTVAHYMVDNGCKFTIDKLLKLGNPSDIYGYTLAHDMAAQNGYKFSENDILRLGNPITNFGETILDLIDWERNDSDDEDFFKL